MIENRLQYLNLLFMGSVNLLSRHRLFDGHDVGYACRLAGDIAASALRIWVRR